MPTSSGKTTSLKLRCEKCDTYTPHEAIKLHPGRFHWSSRRAQLFKRIAGRDLTCRARTRRCTVCNHELETVEMDFQFLKGMMEEIERLEAAAKNATVDLRKLQSDHKSTKDDNGTSSDQDKLKKRLRAAHAEVARLRQGLRRISQLVDDVEEGSARS
jgi:hypothetical protein